MDVNDERFVYKFIQHQIRGQYLLYFFTEDKFLEIQHPKIDVFRCLMLLLCCDDLLDLNFIGTQKTYEQYDFKPYTFEDEFKGVISDAREVLEYWGEEKCKTLKALLI